MPSPRSKPPAVPKSVACVHIDHLSLLLPTEAAHKVMLLLDQAVRVDRDFRRDGSHRLVYVMRGQPDIELAKVHPGQVVRPPPNAEDQPQRQLQLK
jgi:hypothetical protein